jgi:hypothetical protein
MANGSLNEGGSRDWISWDQNRWSEFLVCKIDHEIKIIAKISQDRKNDREIEMAQVAPRELG